MVQYHMGVIGIINMSEERKIWFYTYALTNLTLIFYRFDKRINDRNNLVFSNIFYLNFFFNSDTTKIIQFICNNQFLNSKKIKPLKKDNGMKANNFCALV